MDYETIEIEHDHDFTSFMVELHDIRLFFGPLAVDIHNLIEIIAPDGSRQVIEDIWERVGDLGLLWPLLGRRLKTIVMDEDSARLLFADGTIIRRKYEDRIEVVNVWGPGPNEFTPYPNSIWVYDREAASARMYEAAANMNAMGRKLFEGDESDEEKAFPPLFSGRLKSK